MATLPTGEYYDERFYAECYSEGTGFYAIPKTAAFNGTVITSNLSTNTSPQWGNVPITAQGIYSDAPTGYKVNGINLQPPINNTYIPPAGITNPYSQTQTNTSPAGSSYAPITPINENSQITGTLLMPPLIIAGIAGLIGSLFGSLGSLFGNIFNNAGKEDLQNDQQAFEMQMFWLTMMMNQGGQGNNNSMSNMLMMMMMMRMFSGSQSLTTFPGTAPNSNNVPIPPEIVTPTNPDFGSIFGLNAAAKWS